MSSLTPLQWILGQDKETMSLVQILEIWNFHANLPQNKDQSPTTTVLLYWGSSHLGNATFIPCRRSMPRILPRPDQVSRKSKHTLHFWGASLFQSMRSFRSSIYKQPGKSARAYKLRKNSGALFDQNSGIRLMRSSSSPGQILRSSFWQSWNLFNLSGWSSTIPSHLTPWSNSQSERCAMAWPRS